MTYSIAARCQRSGAFGIAITSSSICVASRCAWVGPLGAVSTQNVTDPALGPAGLALLRQGLGAGAVLQSAAGRHAAAGIAAGRRHRSLRQDRAAFRQRSRCRSLPSLEGDACIALGNLLASPDVPARMIAAYPRPPARRSPNG